MRPTMGPLSRSFGYKPSMTPAADREFYSRVASNDYSYHNRIPVPVTAEFHYSETHLETKTSTIELDENSVAAHVTDSVSKAFSLLRKNDFTEQGQTVIQTYSPPEGTKHATEQEIGETLDSQVRPQSSNYSISRFTHVSRSSEVEKGDGKVKSGSASSQSSYSTQNSLESWKQEADEFLRMAKKSIHGVSQMFAAYGNEFKKANDSQLIQSLVQSLDFLRDQARLMIRLAPLRNSTSRFFVAQNIDIVAQTDYISLDEHLRRTPEECHSRIQELDRMEHMLSAFTDISSMNEDMLHRFTQTVGHEGRPLESDSSAFSNDKEMSTPTVSSVGKDIEPESRLHSAAIESNSEDRDASRSSKVLSSYVATEAADTSAEVHTERDSALKILEEDLQLLQDYEDSNEAVTASTSNGRSRHPVKKSTTQQHVEATTYPKTTLSNHASDSLITNGIADTNDAVHTEHGLHGSGSVRELIKSAGGRIKTENLQRQITYRTRETLEMISQDMEELCQSLNNLHSDNMQENNKNERTSSVSLSDSSSNGSISGFLGTNPGQEPSEIEAYEKHRSQGHKRNHLPKNTIGRLSQLSITNSEAIEVTGTEEPNPTVTNRRESVGRAKVRQNHRRQSKKRPTRNSVMESTDGLALAEKELDGLLDTAEEDAESNIEDHISEVQSTGQDNSQHHSDTISPADGSMDQWDKDALRRSLSSKYPQLHQNVHNSNDRRPSSSLPFEQGSSTMLNPGSGTRGIAKSRGTRSKPGDSRWR